MDATETAVTVSTDGDSFTDGLASRLAAIEDHPLEERGAAYTELHDQLRDRLEGGDVAAAARR